MVRERDELELVVDQELELDQAAILQPERCSMSTTIYGRTGPDTPVGGHQALVIETDGSARVTAGFGGVEVVPGAMTIASSGFGTAAIVVATPSDLLMWTALSRSAATAPFFIMFFDTLVIPPNGAVSDRVPVFVPPGGMASLAQASAFALGIIWVASSTDAVLTIILAADAWVDTSYRS